MSPVKPAGLHHVSINVDDVDAARAFYVDALGLEVRSDRPNLGFGGAGLQAFLSDPAGNLVELQQPGAAPG